MKITIKSKEFYYNLKFPYNLLAYEMNPTPLQVL